MNERHHKNTKVKQVVVVLPIIHWLSIHLHNQCNVRENELASVNLHGKLNDKHAEEDGICGDEEQRDGGSQ